MINSDKTGENSKEFVKKIVELNDDVSQAVIPYVKKDEIRNQLKSLKKTLDDKERAAKAAVAVTVVEKAKELCLANPGAAFIVHKMEAFNNTKALDSALKEVRKMNPETSALFVTADNETKKVFCLASVPKSGVEKGLKANEWVGHLSTVMGGKGGGKPESAQASGTNFENADEIVQLALQFASTKLA